MIYSVDFIILPSSKTTIFYFYSNLIFMSIIAIIIMFNITTCVKRVQMLCKKYLL